MSTRRSAIINITLALIVFSTSVAVFVVVAVGLPLLAGPLLANPIAAWMVARSGGVA